MRLNVNSQCAKILRALQARPGQKVSMPRLASLSGSWNVHCRVDELRNRLGWTQIKNETDVSVRPHQSFYWLPGNHYRTPAAAKNN